MTPHTHALHALRASSSPTLAAIMHDTAPPAERLRIAAGQLDGALAGGEYNRLNSHQRCDLRGLVFMLHSVADCIEAPPPRVARKWWRFWE